MTAQIRTLGPDEKITASDLHKLLRYDEETGKLYWLERHPAPTNWNERFANKEALATNNGRGYLTGSILDCQFLTHRVVWAMATGAWPVGQVDHINGIKTDNRRVNLRDVSEVENKLNQRPPKCNTSGRIGVCKHKPSGRWRATIKKNYKTIHIGYFDQFEDAVVARAQKEAALGFHSNHGVKYEHL